MAVSEGGRCLPRGCLPWEGCLPRGCLPRGRGVCSGGLHYPPVDRTTDACENITFPQLLLQMVRGVSAQGGVHSPVDRMTDACENITFPQLLLRTVKIDGIGFQLQALWNWICVYFLEQIEKNFLRLVLKAVHIINPVNCTSVQVMYWSW